MWNRVNWGYDEYILMTDILEGIRWNLIEQFIIAQPQPHRRRSRVGGCSPPVFAKFLQNLPFLPQILAFLCLQPPHVPVSPHTFKFTPPSMTGDLMHQSIPSTNIPPGRPGVLHSTAAPGPGFILDDLPPGPGFLHIHKITFSTVKKYTFTQLAFGSYLHALHRQFRL